MSRLRAFPITIITSLTILLLVATPALALETKNVAVSKVTGDSAVLVVKTDVTSDVVVDYGSSPGSYSASRESSGLERHEVTLDGLAAGTTVYYRVEITDSGDPGTVINIPEKSFSTAKNNGQPFSFSVHGDNRPVTDTVVQPAMWYTIVAQMVAESADLSLSVGDIIYGVPDSVAQNEARYDGFFASTTPLTYSTPLYVAVGNHERINYGVSRTAYEQEFTMPENNGADAATDGELYYSFDHGDAHFIALCTEIPGETGMVLNDQKAWLEADLAANTKPWVVVFMHKPLMRGVHAGDPWVEPGNATGQQNKADIHALFLQYDVDIVFAGHEHTYLHHLKDGIHYVITGGGGCSISPPPAPVEGDVFGAAEYEHVKVDVSFGQMQVNTIDDDGNVIESYTMSGEPDLEISLVSSHWVSFHDYLSRELTSEFSLQNPGETTAIDSRIVYLGATNGATPLTAVPVAAGDITPGGSATVTLRHHVPHGVVAFQSIAYATCEDLIGNSYAFPGPAPS